MDPLSSAIRVSAAGLGAETTRLRVVSENIANAHSTADVAGGDPYQRKLITFGTELSRADAAQEVYVDSISADPASFPVQFDPTHPAADESGFVKLPNVNVLVEMADMREANRSYQANLQALKQARELVSMTIEMMRGR